MCKNRVELIFKPDIVNKPLTYNLIKIYDIKINIFQAKIYPEEEGHLIVDLMADTPEILDRGIAYLEKEGVEVKLLEKSIIFNKERCINCGACTGVCKSGALTMDNDTWELVINQDKCLFCEMCISACFVKALSMEIG
jgi:L-aspartate semialdehyde sulfurtransferase ferredoxin